MATRTTDGERGARQRRRVAPPPGRDPGQSGNPPATRRLVKWGGQEMLATEAIVAVLRTGTSLKVAAKSVGVSDYAVYQWRRTGGGVWSELAEGKRTEDDLTTYEADCLRFYEESEQAYAQAAALMATRVEMAARGGQVKRRTATVAEYDADGNKVGERVTTIEDVLPPSETAARWWLERRAREEWGPVSRHEHALDVDGPVTVGTDASPLDRLLGQIDSMRSRKRAALEVLPGGDETGEGTAAAG